MIKWRWVDISATCHRLVVDDGTKFGGEVLFECGNIDSELQDRILTLPVLEDAVTGIYNIVNRAIDKVTAGPKEEEAE
jgi:hypothetical protein